MTKNTSFNLKNFPTPSKIAKEANITIQELLGDGNIKNLSHQSLSNLLKSNPEKYKALTLGLVSIAFDIELSDLIYLKENKDSLKKIS